MTERELTAAARHALSNLENERELPRNPLLRGDSLSYGTLRFIVLSALESIGTTAGNGSAARKRRLRHNILVRCDLGGEDHRTVFETAALSRRQFYRERREALLSLGESIEQRVAVASRAQTSAPATVVDLGDAAEAYLEALRSAGQYRLVWQEATELARRASGDPKAMEFWLVASEAARFSADESGARDALEQARHLRNGESHWRSLWLASSTMSLQWFSGDSVEARETIDRVVKADSDERALHGKEAVLLAITLVTAASMEIDCGRWERARSFLARASSLAKSGTGAKRQGLLRLASIIFRLSGDVALHADGDDARAIAAYRAALEAARVWGDLGTVAMTAVRLAAALDERDVRQALSLADYGLEIASRFYRGDRFAEATLELMPLLLRGRGPEAAEAAIAKARGRGLGARDSLFLSVAEIEAAANAGRFEAVVEREEELSTQLRRQGIDALACDVELTAAEAYAKLGRRGPARRKIQQFAETMEFARATTRARARELAPILDATVMLPA